MVSLLAEGIGGRGDKDGEGEAVKTDHALSQANEEKTGSQIDRAC